MDAIERLMEGRTSLMVAHRISTLDMCDARIEIEGGRVTRARGVTLDGQPITPLGRQAIT
jgi:ABC-type multidrug transport system fused ATPase/permease subunit